jgi:valyl-tRNA synthetase
MLEKTFDPAAIEVRWYAHWEGTGAFRPARPDAQPFTIVIPPPNVTGSLHIGHALDATLQDVIIRWQRLKGRDARWIVGTDHAGIATQMVVERQLAEASQGTTRQAMGREAFLQTVWDWKETSGTTITRQLRRLGASCDWANERFTMDEGFNAAVNKVFVQLYNEGLLYRDKRLVNWDPKLKTAISDLEVETREVAGTFTHIRYPLADGVTLPDGRDHIVVATTRPETMLGDTAVAVNAADPRYQSVIGKFVQLPITGRRIPIIADDHADPELGSGAVKITPAHDFNDFEVGKRHNLPMLNILDADAKIIATDGVPAAYVGLDRFDARKRIVEELEATGLIAGIEQKTIQMPYGDRSGVVVEPWLTDQWYVNAAELAKPAIESVRSGTTRFVPESWSKTYFAWMENIQPWCVSRQLWWGHRIPAWYGPKWDPDGILHYDLASGDYRIFVEESEEAAIVAMEAYYQRPRTEIDRVGGPTAAFQRGLQGVAERVQVWRDEDVLDTWFSSALWPFATLGWPQETPDLARHYPGNLLVTGFDIIFFWVARMMMQGLHFKGEAPFHTVYCHGLVRDAKGAKMSKSKGNTVDPLTLVDRFGADALRFTLVAMESQGRDIKLDEKRVEGYRNFATKLWNAVRFCQSNGIGASQSTDAPIATLPVNRWILTETAAAAAAAEAALTAYRFDQYAATLYQFVWSRFCDWYLELIKPLLAEEGAAADETRATAAWAIDRILTLLHPAMPFLTEELWHAQAVHAGTPRATDLIHAPWPTLTPGTDPASAEIAWLIDLISAIRSARTELNVPPGAKLALHAPEADAALQARLQAHVPALERLARVESLDFTPPPTGGTAQLVVEGVGYALPLAGTIDLAAEKARLLKAAEQAEKEAASLAARLNSPGFTERAKPEAVEKAREDHAARSAEAQRLRAALARLG